MITRYHNNTLPSQESRRYHNNTLLGHHVTMATRYHDVITARYHNNTLQWSMTTHEQVWTGVTTPLNFCGDPLSTRYHEVITTVTMKSWQHVTMTTRYHDKAL